LQTQQTGLFPKVFTTELILPKSETNRSSNDSSNRGPGKNAASYDSQTKGSVHETISDIDEAISELIDTNLAAAAAAAAAAGGETTSETTVMPNMDNIQSWTPFEVRHYFDYRGYEPAVSDQFVHHKITGSILLELDLAFLKEIDIASFGTRFEISKDIKYLNSIVAKSPEGNKISRPPKSAGQGLMMPPTFKSEAPLAKQPKRPSTDGSSAVISPRTSSLKSENGTPNGSSNPYFKTRIRQSPNAYDSGYVGSPQTPELQMDQKPVLAPPEMSFESPVSSSTASFEKDWTSSAPTISGRSYTADGDLSGRPYVGDIRTPYKAHSRGPSGDTVRAEQAPYKMPKHTRSASSVDVQFAEVGDSSPATRKSHRRHSSILSFMSQKRSASPLRKDVISERPAPKSPKRISTDPIQQLSPTTPVEPQPKRSTSAASKPKPKLRHASSQNNLRKPAFTKRKTSAFQEGIRQVTAEDSAKTASFSGWMHKRGGIGVGAWKSRYFALHGTRLSYFGSFSDTKEKGLIDITGHRVLPARENEDKLVSLYAASVGAGRHCFKLVPPAPGFRKGVTFTAPKVHYFAVDTKEDMRSWMAALMKATIDRDETVPVISSCATPTVPLPKAQELFAEARAREEDLRARMIAGGLAANNGSANANPASAKPIVTNVQTFEPYPSTPDSPTGSSFQSSRTGSSTNSSSLKVSTSPNGYAMNMNNNNDFQSEVRHLTTKTAGLKIVTDLEENNNNLNGNNANGM
jgi:hypothetical protein